MGECQRLEEVPKGVTVGSCGLPSPCHRELEEFCGAQGVWPQEVQQHHLEPRQALPPSNLLMSHTYMIRFQLFPSLALLLSLLAKSLCTYICFSQTSWNTGEKLFFLLTQFTSLSLHNNSIKHFLLCFADGKVGGVLPPKTVIYTVIGASYIKLCCKI